MPSATGGTRTCGLGTCRARPCLMTLEPRGPPRRRAPSRACERDQRGGAPCRPRGQGARLRTPAPGFDRPSATRAESARETSGSGLAPRAEQRSAPSGQAAARASADPGDTTPRTCLGRVPRSGAGRPWSSGQAPAAQELPSGSCEQFRDGLRSYRGGMKPPRNVAQRRAVMPGRGTLPAQGSTRSKD